MAKTDYAALAPDLLTKVGGQDNVRSLAHCATRLRFVLKDESKADTEAVKATGGVVTVVQAGGQYQVVIGNDVPQAYAELMKILGPMGEEEDAPAERKNPLDAFISLVSGIISPMLWTLAGTGLFKAFLTMFTTLGWLAEDTDTYTVLYAASDAFMNFLPMVLAVTAARHFKANQFTSMAIAGALVYPSIIALNEAGGPHDFFGIPLVMMSYTSSVIPIIVAVWVQSHLERLFMRYIPSAFRNFMTPWLTVLIMVPLTLLTIGPATTYLADGIAGGVQWLFATVPLLGGAIMGGLWQVFVIFGLHWGFVPLMTQEITTNGYSVMTGPLVAPVLAQAAAGLAVMLRSRDAKTRELAGPAAVSGFLAGVTEPVIYGINLPRRLPLYFGIAGGAVGGAIGALAGARTTSAGVFPSIIGLPAWMDATPNVPLFLVGVVVAVVMAFVLTYFFGVRDDAGQAGTAPGTGDEAPGTAAPRALDVDAAETTGDVDVIVTAPVPGRVIALEDVPDPVFSSGVMGKGAGIVPADGSVVAPVAGEVVATTDTGHAVGIRTDDGVEVLIHIGIDTVNMKGEGFTTSVSKGQRVVAGQELVRVDLTKVEAAGYSTVTALLVTNTAAHKEVTASAVGEEVSAGDPVVIVSR
ncbi:PTS beta-glucoside transporter subunit IIBCA [Actinomyces lilanjuaniae]|uniref:PTS beta-glucoside transporter subunit IIBCA n=1 Tax=Actinomyces lilanjuaniae TaxID=2321394 RepID=A0ABM6Z3X2_9ACTO|nr:beta-glucoside-specific PTS transporter subunit IIABC [Actinomyces lilanjuaniae]AYD89820.1 PTS beta-glucoside transporter subunit IIBCA [Actinomyces lilanjuaniae]